MRLSSCLHRYLEYLLEQEAILSTRLIYGDIELSNILTKSITVEPVLSDDKVDVLYNHITVEVRAVLNAALEPAIDGETNITQTARRIRACLMQQRQELQVIIGGEVYLQSPVAGKTTDSKLGPHPMYCRIVNVGGDQTFMVEYGIESWLSECPDCDTAGATPAAVTNPYVSHRWTETHEFSDTFYMKRIVEGKIILKAEALLAPESMIGTVFASIPAGFERRESKYTVQSDGLALIYRFVDQQVKLVAPAPASKWSGYNIISTSNGGVYDQEVVVRLEGTKEASKSQLLGVAAGIVLSRMPGLRARYIIAGSVQEALHENWIEVKAKIKNLPVNDTLFGFIRGNGVNAWNTVGGVDRPGSNATNYVGGGLGQQVAPSSVNFPIGFLVKFIDDPCLQTAQQLQYENTGSVVRPVQGSVAATVDVTDSLTQTVSFFDEEEISEDAPYNDYVIETTYRTNYHRLQLPLATSTGPTTAFATMALPTMTKVVTWTTERIGDQPTIPDPTIFDPNNVLLEDKVIPQAPFPLPDGATMVWRISGEYVYGLKEADACVFQAGKYPFMSWDRSVTDLEPDIFSTNIIESDGGTIIEI